MQMTTGRGHAARLIPLLAVLLGLSPTAVAATTSAPSPATAHQSVTQVGWDRALGVRLGERGSRAARHLDRSWAPCAFGFRVFHKSRMDFGNNPAGPASHRRRIMAIATNASRYRFPYGIHAGMDARAARALLPATRSWHHDRGWGLWYTRSPRASRHVLAFDTFEGDVGYLGVYHSLKDAKGYLSSLCYDGS